MKRLRLIVPDGFFATPPAAGNWRDEVVEAEQSPKQTGPLGRTGYFFLELDRGNASLTVMRDKYLRYVRLFRKKILHDLFHVPHFRVLTITTSEKRVLNLITTVREGVPFCHGMFWFASKDSKENLNHQHSLNARNILRKVWRRASDDHCHSILD